MEYELKPTARTAIRRSLDVLVRVALRVGVSAPEFEEIVKDSYFQCAREDYGLRNRPTNLARVAVLTGLSRKECSRLKKKGTGQDKPPAASSMNIATRIMTVWATDSRYSTGGVPQPLAQKGGADSLEGLISEHVGDIPTGAVIAELNRVKALQEEPDGKVRLVQRSFLPPGLNDEKLRILGNQFSDLGSSVLFNLDEVKQSRMQRYVVNDRLPKHLVPKFQELATALAQALLEQLDSWLSEHEQSASQTKPVQQTARTGLGVYFFENK